MRPSGSLDLSLGGIESVPRNIKANMFHPPPLFWSKVSPHSNNQFTKLEINVLAHLAHTTQYTFPSINYGLARAVIGPFDSTNPLSG